MSRLGLSLRMMQMRVVLTRTWSRGCSWWVSLICVSANLYRRVQSASRARCNIGFAELSVNISSTLLPTTVPVLLDILRDIPYIDFDMNLTWDGEFSAPFSQVNCRTKTLPRLVFARPISLYNCFRAFEACRGPYGIRRWRHDRCNDLYVCPCRQTTK